MPVNTKQWHTEIGSFNGPQKEKTKNVSCCIWNVNSLKAHTLSKLSQFINTTLSVYLKRSLTLQYNKGKNIQLDGYNLLRADQPSNSKRGGVN